MSKLKDTSTLVFFLFLCSFLNFVGVVRRRRLVLTVHQRRSFVLPAKLLGCVAEAFQPGDFNVVAIDCRAVSLNLMILIH